MVLFLYVVFVKLGDPLSILVYMCICGTPAPRTGGRGYAGACKRATRGTPMRIMRALVLARDTIMR